MSCYFMIYFTMKYEPRHVKTNIMSVRPAKTQISLGIRPVWSESSLSAWRNLGPLATHWAHSKDADQTGRMPRLIWVFAGRTVILLVLSCCGSYDDFSVPCLLNMMLNILNLCEVWNYYYFYIVSFFSGYMYKAIRRTLRLQFKRLVFNIHFLFILNRDLQRNLSFYCTHLHSKTIACY